MRDITRKFVAPVTSPESADAILVAVNEAASNCVRHARTPFRVELIEESDHIVVSITDSGQSPFDGNNYSAPEPGDQDGKIGVPIIRALMDDIEWRADNGTTLRMRKAKHCPDLANLVPMHLSTDQIVYS